MDQPTSKASAVQQVAARLRAGFEPMITGAGPRWARLRGRRLEQAALTPDQGMVLDELVILQTHTEAGFRHLHRVGGRRLWHRHADGWRPHRHTERAGSEDAVDPKGTTP